MRSVQVSRAAPAGYVRALRNPLYDTDNILAAPTTQIRLYQVPIGQLNASAVRKTEADTNLNQAGQLANPQMFDLHGFQLEVAIGTVIADHILLYTRGVFEFSFGTQRIWLQLPLSRIPQGTAIYGVGSGAAASPNLFNGAPSVREYYPFVQPDGAPYPIKATETFQVRLFWPSAAISPSAVTLLRCYMIGTLYIGL
jgi:hypothetical protein